MFRAFVIIATLTLASSVRAVTYEVPAYAEPISFEAATTRAQNYIAQYPGSSMATILPTGSMYPTIDWDCIIVLVPIPYEKVQRGDIIVFIRIEDGIISKVAHRVRCIYKDGFCTQGDNGLQPDPGVVTRDRYRGVIGYVSYFKLRAHKPDPLNPSKLRNSLPVIAHRTSPFSVFKTPPNSGLGT